MSRILVVTVAAIALALGALALSPRAPAVALGGHCGCLASRPDGCQEPCSSCCGPGGYADCFANPGPSVATTSSGSCCRKP